MATTIRPSALHTTGAVLSAQIRSDVEAFAYPQSCSFFVLCRQVRDADMVRENVGIQNSTWLVRQVFHKYRKAIRLVRVERARMKRSVLLRSVIVLYSLFDPPPMPLVQSQSRVDGVSRGSRALEGDDVTAVGRESTATGRLPCGAGHIGRRGAAVPRVG